MRPSKVALLILGMHRSGTSALARVLNLLGAALPRELLGPHSGNATGHWEPLSILSLNEEILTSLGRSWHDVRAFESAWFERPEASDFRRRVEEILDIEYEDAQLIVLKEPRVCRLVPLYLDAIQRSGYSARIIMPTRDPREIIASLKHRDEMNEVEAEWIWMRHLLEAEKATRDCPRVWVNFDDLLSDWHRVQARIAEALGVTWPVAAPVARQEIDDFLSPTLRNFDIRKGQASVEIGLLAERLWHAASSVLTGFETVLRREFDEVRSMVDEIDRLNAPQLARNRRIESEAGQLRLAFDETESRAVAERTNREVAEQIAAAERKGREIAEDAIAAERIGRETAEQAATAERIGRETAEQAVTAERMGREMAEQATSAERRHREACEQAASVAALRFEAELSEQRERLSELYASTSWRLTGPFRAMAKLLNLNRTPARARR